MGDRMKNRTHSLLIKGTSIQKWSVGLAMLLLSVGIMLPGCKHEPPFPPELVDDGGNGGGPTPVDDPCDLDSVYFQNTVLPLLVSYCAGTGCHDAITHEDGVSLYDYAHIMQQVTPGDPADSDLWDKGIAETGGDAMPPPDQPQLTAQQEQAIYTWIMQGAQNNACAGCDTTNVTYNGTIKPLFQSKCNGCHSGSSPDGNLDLSQYAVANTVAMDGRLAGSVQHLSSYNAMPPSGGMLPNCEIDQLLIWIQDGAPNN